MFVRMTADQWAAAQRRNAQAGAPRARRGVHQKYGNQRVTTEAGERFDSKAEYRHWLHLRVLEQAGRIRELRRQVAFELAPAVVLGGRRKPALRYVADFVYLDEAGRQVVEDVKGAVTPVWQIKRHLMAAVHGIEVKEVRA